MAHTLPLYVQIQEQLRSDIKTGEFKPGKNYRLKTNWPNSIQRLGRQ